MGEALETVSTRIGVRPTGPLAANRQLDSCYPSPAYLCAALREGVAAERNAARLSWLWVRSEKGKCSALATGVGQGTRRPG